MALSMNSVGILGGFRGNTGFSGKFGVWGGFGQFGGSKGFCANSHPSPPPSQFTVCTSRFAGLRRIMNKRAFLKNADSDVRFGHLSRI